MLDPILVISFEIKNIHCSNSYFDEPKTWFNNDYMLESEKMESIRLQEKYDLEPAEIDTYLDDGTDIFELDYMLQNNGMYE